MNKVPMKNSIKIGQVLKRLLRERRKTLKEVSEATKIPYSTLHTWLENRQPKDVIKAQELAEYFSIFLEELLFDNVKDNNHKQETLTSQSDLKFIEGRFEVTVKKIGRD